MGVKDRLIEFVTYTQMSRRKFQEYIGVSNSYIQNISEGIGNDVMNSIAKRFPELNIAWLLTGEGEMLKPDSGIHNNKVSGNSGTVTMNNGQHISISLPEEGTQKIINPDGSVQIISNQSKSNEYLELLREKDKQIERLLSIIENKSK